MTQIGQGHRAKAPLAEKAFKRANPEWEVIKPWVQNLKRAVNDAEWMLQGKFKARGPLGNEREVNVNVYRDGIRIF